MKIDIYKFHSVQSRLALENHGVVAFPTETVMGLGVYYNDYEAYTKLNKVKRRPEDKPYTMMLSSKELIKDYALTNEKIDKIIDKFMPGSITILVHSKETVPAYVTHNTGIIGLRIPTNYEAKRLLKEAKLPLLVPSANRSGEAPCLTSEEVEKVFKDEIDYIFPGNAYFEKPSTIVNLTNETPVLVRPGPIDFNEILKVWNS